MVLLIVCVCVGYLQILEYPCQFPGRLYDDQQI